jgi:hypothetical protein
LSGISRTNGIWGIVTIHTTQLSTFFISLKNKKEFISDLFSQKKKNQKTPSLLIKIKTNMSSVVQHTNA